MLREMMRSSSLIVTPSSLAGNRSRRASMARAAVVALLTLAMLQGGSAAPQGSRVTSLPGLTFHPRSEHYAGYVTVNQENGRQLYYYLVTSETGSAATDPLIVWLTGGPGCSSIDGLLYLHGPFRFEPHRSENESPKLQENPNRWSKFANVLYLDSPAGTGYSYSKFKDYTVDDSKSTDDLHRFLLKWIELYPEYKSSPMYISGESYAGRFVPSLCKTIVAGIEAGIQPVLNLKGYTVGNPVTDTENEINSIIPFVRGVGLISEELFEAAQRHCGANVYNSTDTLCGFFFGQIKENVKYLNRLYFLKPCPNVTRHLSTHVRKLQQTELESFGTKSWICDTVGQIPTLGNLGNKVAPPCQDDTDGTLWLNDPNVREALHASPIDVTGPWEFCTGKLAYTADVGSMIPIHKHLTTKGYRALVYNGDHDLCIPFSATEAWIRGLGYEIVDRWRPWFVDGLVGGFTQGYDKQITFVTVLGAGHSAPRYKPKEVARLLQRWLTGLSI